MHARARFELEVARDRRSNCACSLSLKQFLHARVYLGDGGPIDLIPLVCSLVVAVHGCYGARSFLSACGACALSAAGCPAVAARHVWRIASCSSAACSTWCQSFAVAELVERRPAKKEEEETPEGGPGREDRLGVSRPEGEGSDELAVTEARFGFTWTPDAAAAAVAAAAAASCLSSPRGSANPASAIPRSYAWLISRSSSSCRWTRRSAHSSRRRSAGTTNLETQE